MVPLACALAPETSSAGGEKTLDRVFILGGSFIYD